MDMHVMDEVKIEEKQRGGNVKGRDVFNKHIYIDVRQMSSFLFMKSIQATYSYICACIYLQEIWIICPLHTPYNKQLNCINVLVDTRISRRDIRKSFLLIFKCMLRSFA